MAFLLGGYNGINNICNMMQKKAELLRDGHSVTYQGLYGSAQQDPPPAHFSSVAICRWEAKLV